MFSSCIKKTEFYTMNKGLIRTYELSGERFLCFLPFNQDRHRPKGREFW